eukprot:m51a1_g5510 hypothetical protein (289) ;mRNA; r:387429-388295
MTTALARADLTCTPCDCDEDDDGDPDEPEPGPSPDDTRTAAVAFLTHISLGRPSPQPRGSSAARAAPVAVPAPAPARAKRPSLSYKRVLLTDPTPTTHMTTLEDDLDRALAEARARRGARAGEADAEELWRLRCPAIVETGVSLRRYQKVKRSIAESARAVDAELGSVALAYALVERLCRTGRTRRSALKLHGAACLWLAIKFADARVSADFLRGARDAICREMDREPRDLLRAEWDVFVRLGLSVFVDPDVVNLHYRRLLMQRPELMHSSSSTPASCSTRSQPFLCA